MGSKDNNPISEEDIKKAQEALNSAKVLKENRWGIVDGEVKQFTDNLGCPIGEGKKECTTNYIWTVASPLFKVKDIENITRKATRWQKVRLLFRHSHYSWDEGSIIRYKQMDGITFIMKRGTHIKKENNNA